MGIKKSDDVLILRIIFYAAISTSVQECDAFIAESCITVRNKILYPYINFIFIHNITNTPTN